MTVSLIAIVGVAIVAAVVWFAARDKLRGESESYVLGRWRRHRDG